MTTRSLVMDVSLLHGWLPLVAQAVAVVALVVAVGQRSRSWSLRWLPVGAIVGVVAVVLIHWFIADQGLSGHPAPLRLWLWILLTAVAGVVLGIGWRAGRRRQRIWSAVAVPLSLLCVALSVNSWVGYLPTVASVWERRPGATGGEIDLLTSREMQAKKVEPIKGTVVGIDIPSDASGFKHRREMVYLPPAWYSRNPPLAFPVVMMIGGEFGDPRDWPGAGATKILDDFAAQHGGNAPVVVFVDHSGTFINDTECVNGKRGNAADHLTKDVVPYLIANFGVSSNPAHWGIVGWSAGGTCALTLTLKYPNLFRAFVAIDGQSGPNAGTRAQTIQRLYDGDEKAWAAFDPATVMAEHGPYDGVSAWFAVSESTESVYRAGDGLPGHVDVHPPDPSGDTAGVAQYMCALASGHGIECAVVPEPGGHDFPSAVKMFRMALPWLAGRLGTPGVPAVRLKEARSP